MLYMRQNMFPPYTYAYAGIVILPLIVITFENIQTLYIINYIKPHIQSQKKNLVLLNHLNH